MKNLILIIMFLLLCPSLVYAENSILGKWRDKKELYENPQFEFKKNQDFIYTRTDSNGNSFSEEGVWETGSWTVGKSKCNLSIYIGENQCCFEYKFIANNLILTSVYKSGYSPTICDNRVLIRETKEGK